MAEIYKSLSIGNIQIMATFNFGNFQFNSSKVLIFAAETIQERKLCGEIR